MANGRVIVTTQYRENYGAHDWDGCGECPQYWKMKGGYEYQVATITHEDFNRGINVLSLVKSKLPKIESNDDYSNEYMVDWAIYWDGEKTPDEKMHEEMAADGYPSFRPAVEVIA